MQETQDVDLVPGSGRAPGGGNEAHCSVLSWRIPWTEQPGGYSPWGGTVDWATEHIHTLLFVIKMNKSCACVYLLCASVCVFNSLNISATCWESGTSTWLKIHSKTVQSNSFTLPLQVFQKLLSSIIYPICSNAIHQIYFEIIFIF